MLNQILALIISPLLLIVTQNLVLIHSSITPPPPAFNLSHFLFPKVTTFTESINPPPQPPHFLQGVLEAVAKKEKWVLEDFRVSELDVKKAKYATVQRYELGIPVGKSEIVLKMYEKATEWMKLAALKSDSLPEFETLVREVGAKAVIGSFKIEGPFVLQSVGSDDQLSLMLPSNVSHSGLRRILVGKGITVEVKGAEVISIVHTPNRQQIPYGVLYNVISIRPPVCTAFAPIRVTGSAQVVAYRSKRPATYIQTQFSSQDSIELLPDKCYGSPGYQNPRHLFSSIAFVERVVTNLSSEKLYQDIIGLGSLKLSIRASAVFRFLLEVEKVIRSTDDYWSTLAEWRTRPIVERVWFEVVARLEGEILKPLGLKKSRPFVDVDSFAWSSLLSNLSFTKFPSALVPSESLTLDVKW